MTKRILGLFLLLASVPSLAQLSAYNVAGRTIASQYALWQAYTTNAVSAGVNAITLDRCYVTAGQTSGRQFVPYATNVALTIHDTNTETVIPTAVVTPVTGFTTCTVTANFAFPHSPNVLVTSGDGGLGEAVNDTKLSGGLVTIDPSFTGTTGTITGLTGGAANVALEDIRGGVWQIYSWNGSQYIPGSGVKGLSLALLSPLVSDSGALQVGLVSGAVLEELDCSTDTGTVGVNFDARSVTSPNTQGPLAMASPFICDATGETTTQFSAGVLTPGQLLVLDVLSISGTPSVVRLQVKYQ